MTDVVQAKFDWWQAVFYNNSPAFILFEFLGLEPKIFDPALCESFSRYTGYDNQVGFQYNGILITGHSREVSDSDDFINSTYSRLQVQISGSGLDYLRSLGLDVNSICRTPICYDSKGNPQWHVTRVDFAFDFINFPSDFWSLCNKFLYEHYSDLSGVKIAGSDRPLKYSVRNGSEHTIYIGATRSNKLLRIYDKKLEQSDSHGVLKSNPIDANIFNWSRLELQTRNDVAHHLLFGSVDFSDVLRYIYDTYCFVDRNNQRVRFWDLFICREELGSIIQNANYIKPVTDTESLKRRLSKVRSLLLAYVAVYGLDSLDLLLSEEIDLMNRPDPLGSYHCKKVFSQIGILSDYSIPYDSLKGVDLNYINHHTSLKLKERR